MCGTCGDARAITWALALVMVVLAVAVAALAARRGRGGRDSFVSQRARDMYAAAAPVLRANGSFSDFKRAAGPDADVAQYSALRAAAQRGGLTPEAVQAALSGA